MRIIVACEFSGIVRDAFEAAGADAWSCDLLPSDSLQTINSGKHIIGDVLDHLDDNAGDYDMLIGHPPCTFLSYASNRVWDDPGRCKKRLEALDFFRKLWEQPIKRICLENPAGCASPTISKYSQHVEPFYFGDAYYKRTWLWLKNLPKLEKTNEVKPTRYLVNGSNSARRGYQLSLQGERSPVERSRFHPGMAAAMAAQWL